MNRDDIGVRIGELEGEHVCQSDRIVAFTETPSSEYFGTQDEQEQEICACDLFSIFTADIIKSKTLFSR
jgi:hypothetical protein